MGYILDEEALEGNYTDIESNSISSNLIIEDLEERYGVVPQQENYEYWEDIAGAALIDQEILSCVEDSRMRKLNWARNQEYAPRNRDIARDVLGTGIGTSALLKHGDVFFDGSLDTQTVAGVGVLASTALLGRVAKHDIERLSGYISELPETREKYGSVVERALNEIRKNEPGGEERQLDPAESVYIQKKYSNSEVREKVEFPDTLIATEENLERVSREMEEAYQEIKNS